MIQNEIDAFIEEFSKEQHVDKRVLNQALKKFFYYKNKPSETDKINIYEKILNKIAVAYIESDQKTLSGLLDNIRIWHCVNNQLKNNDDANATMIKNSSFYNLNSIK